MTYRSVNPATGEVLKTFPEHSDQQVMDTVGSGKSVEGRRHWARAKTFQPSILPLVSLQPIWPTACHTLL